MQLNPQPKPNMLPPVVVVLKSYYGLIVCKIPIKFDNTSAINLSKNPIHHSRTKHIEIRHHFIRDHVLRGDVALEYINTKEQIADIFTKPLDKDQFGRIRGELGLMDLP